MIRKRNILLILLIIVGIFVLTTNYLFDLLIKKINIDNIQTSNNVKNKIFKHLNNLPEYYFNNEQLNIVQVNYIKNLYFNKSDRLDLLWKEAKSWVSKSRITNFSSNKLGQIFNALRYGKIINADLDVRGTQLKFLLTLEGKQNVVFKPKWYDKGKIIEGPVYAGKDRYFSEIIAFYLSIIFGKPFVPISNQRTISLKNELIPVATQRLLQTSFLKKNRTCIYGKCFYCKKQDPICEDDNFHLDGAVILNIRGPLKSFRSPWQRTYKIGRKATWEEDENYCKFVRTKLTKKRLLDLIDTAIFDFFIQNGDRHHYETLHDNIILLDNGKGLGNPFYHHIDILAPLYQCCILRETTWKTLQSLSGNKLTNLLNQMPNIDELIIEEHLKAFEKRLLIIFATIEYCKNRQK